MTAKYSLSNKSSLSQDDLDRLFMEINNDDKAYSDDDIHMSLTELNNDINTVLKLFNKNTYSYDNKKSDSYYFQRYGYVNKGATIIVDIEQ